MMINILIIYIHQAVAGPGALSAVHISSHPIDGRPDGALLTGSAVIFSSVASLVTSVVIHSHHTVTQPCLSPQSDGHKPVIHNSSLLSIKNMTSFATT